MGSLNPGALGAGVSPLPLCAPTTHREAVLPKLHLDEDYPCSLVGNWNTWYGEQDQAGELPTPQHRWLPSTPPIQWCPGGSFSVQSLWASSPAHICDGSLCPWGGP